MTWKKIVPCKKYRTQLASPIHSGKKCDKLFVNAIASTRMEIMMILVKAGRKSKRFTRRLPMESKISSTDLEWLSSFSFSENNGLCVGFGSD